MYPNRGPFAQDFPASSPLTFFLPETRHVALIVYDAMGREVRRLVDGELIAGEHRTEFNADGLASGTFYAKLIAGDQVITRRMTLLR